MNMRRLAIVAILIFLGQQAGSLWASAMFSGHPHGHPSIATIDDDATAVHCDSVEQAHHADDRDAASESDDCCQLECECCVGHCQSIQALMSPSLTINHSSHSHFPAISQSTRTTNQRHFRPPIFA